MTARLPNKMLLVNGFLKVGENYYLPMTAYIATKTEAKTESLPGPLCFSERIAQHPIVGQA